MIVGDIVMKLLKKTNSFNRLIVGKPLGVGLENLLFLNYISFDVAKHTCCRTR